MSESSSARSRPGMIADMDIIHGNPLQDIETIANDGM